MKAGDIRRLSEQGAKEMNDLIGHHNTGVQLCSGDEVVVNGFVTPRLYWCTPLSQKPSKSTNHCGDHYTWALSEEDFIKEQS